MQAREIKDKYLKEEVKDICGVIAIGKDFWYHVHDSETVPEGNDFTIAIHPREWWEVKEVENNSSEEVNPPDLVDPIEFIQVQ